VTLASDLGERLQRAARLTEADPLSWWHHSSPQTREATRWAVADEPVEVYLRKPNKCGGTEWGAALVLALLQGREALDGERLPRLDSRGPSAIVRSPTRTCASACARPSVPPTPDVSATAEKMAFRIPLPTVPPTIVPKRRP